MSLKKYVVAGAFCLAGLSMSTSVLAETRQLTGNGRSETDLAIAYAQARADLTSQCNALKGNLVGSERVTVGFGGKAVQIIRSCEF